MQSVDENMSIEQTNQQDSVDANDEHMQSVDGNMSVEQTNQQSSLDANENSAGKFIYITIGSTT